MFSIGLDLAEIGRIAHSMKNPRFCSRILGEQEYAQLQSRGFPIQSVAASFCAKEAFAKALGTGVRGFLLTEVELLREPNGKPVLRLSGSARRLAREKGFDNFVVSATHTKDYASVVVLAHGGEKNGIEL